MGKSRRWLNTMRSLLISLVLLVLSVQADDFKGQRVTLGKRKCTCDFRLDMKEACKGTAKCDKKCSGAGKVEVGGCSFVLQVKKGAGKISKCACDAAQPTIGPVTGSGSGPEPPTGSGSGPSPPIGSGSGEHPVPLPGSGSGPQPPAGGESMQCGCKCDCPQGTGECDCDCNCPMNSQAVNCAPGFSKVCPMMGDQCPEYMEQVCPSMPTTMPLPAGRMMGAGDRGCQCVPDFLLSLVMGAMTPAGRSAAMDRAMTKVTFKIGKTTCKCQYEINQKDCKRSKMACDKKCNGKISGLELEDGNYVMSLMVKKGKVAIQKCEAKTTEPTGTGGGPGSGSGNGGGSGMGSGPGSGMGGGMGGMGTRCACVSMGGGPMPPTGSGSGPNPPTGTGSGSGPEPPTGSGNGGSSESDCKCGLAKRSTRIVGGQVTEVNEYPWQAGIVSKRGKSVWCGGTLISDLWIMTAAHCTKGESASGIQVLLGEHNYNDNSETETLRMNIASIIDHPDYNHQTTNYDFSLLKMTQAVDFAAYPHIRPACLPADDSNDYNNFVATVTGWGTTSSGGSTSSKLREVDVEVLTNDECKNDYGYSRSDVTSQMLCANVNGGGKDACQGDSGGPLVTSGQGNGVTAGQNYELIGVVSWGIGCASANHPGVYARVTKQLDWISSTTGSSWNTCPRL